MPRDLQHLAEGAQGFGTRGQEAVRLPDTQTQPQPGSYLQPLLLGASLAFCQGGSRGARRLEFQAGHHLRTPALASPKAVVGSRELRRGCWGSRGGHWSRASPTIRGLGLQEGIGIYTLTITKP